MEDIMQKRFEVRRSAIIPIEVAAPSWDEPVDLLAGDLSPRGMYLFSEEMPEVGEYIFCSFGLAGNADEYCFMSRVNRINWHRRRTDCLRPGFGIEFMDTRPLERLRLRATIRGLPMPAPSKMRGGLFDIPAIM
jgi:hypothetical protein